jgi:hypothetical protein
MPIYELLRHTAFEPEHIEAMARAFELVCSELELKDPSDPLCELVAHKVIECAQRGSRDPERLTRLVLSALQRLPSATAVRMSS